MAYDTANTYETIELFGLTEKDAQLPIPEDHILTVPRERAAQFPRTVQNLMGYRGHGPYLGRFAEDPDGFWHNKH